MQEKLRAGDCIESLLPGIRRAGELLAAAFPPTGSDRNELPDDPAGDGKSPTA
jgi:uncharacterized membrane protein